MTILSTKPHTPRVPIQELAEAVHAVLVQGDGITALELVPVLGYSHGTIRKRLRALEDLGRAHTIKKSSGKHGGFTFIWYAGQAVAATAPAPAIEGAYVAPIDMPQRRTIRVYPPVNRRDPLVAALFGPAKPAGMLTGILSGEPA